MRLARRSKYGARRTEYNGQVYASKAEAAFAQLLDLWQKAGKIESWTRGERQILVDGGTRRRRITYKPDMIVRWLNGTTTAYDVKGAPPPRDFRLRAILWEHRFPSIPLRVVDHFGAVKWSLDD